LLNAGSSIAARMAMMAITTKSSIKVNPQFRLAAGRDDGTLSVGHIFFKIGNTGL